MSNTTFQTNNSMIEQEPPRPTVPQRRVTFTPQVDILELPDELVLLVDLPGVKSDGVNIHFERGELTLHAYRDTAEKQGHRLVEEFEAGDFYRAFLISQDVAADKISAELKNGVLSIRLPKAVAAQPRRIAVKGS